jgi:hypothetical protein
MPAPRWLAEVNKRLFNKIELRRGVRPVTTHVGRSSGRTYHTPLEAHPVESGYIFILVYGSGSDCKNVLAAGTARLNINDEMLELTSPRIVTKDVAWRLPAATKAPANYLNATEYPQMNV